MDWSEKGPRHSVSASKDTLDKLAGVGENGDAKCTDFKKGSALPGGTLFLFAGFRALADDLHRRLLSKACEPIIQVSPERKYASTARKFEHTNFQCLAGTCLPEGGGVPKP